MMRMPQLVSKGEAFHLRTQGLLKDYQSQIVIVNTVAPVKTFVKNSDASVFGGFQ